MIQRESLTGSYTVVKVCFSTSRAGWGALGQVIQVAEDDRLGRKDVGTPIYRSPKVWTDLKVCRYCPLCQVTQVTGDDRFGQNWAERGCQAG